MGAAKAQKEKEPAKEPEKVALKKRPEKAQEPAQEQTKEVPKLKKVETVKRESPVRRSQSPIPQLKRVTRDSRENTPVRAQSPIPNLRPVPKKGSPAPGKAKTQVVKKQVTAKTDSNKQSDSIDTTVKQSHSDIELHKKEKNDSKSKEIIPEHEVPETVDKPSPTKGTIPETVNKSKYPHEENEQEHKRPIALIPENKYESVQDIDKVDSVDIPELEVVQQPPQTTFEDYPEELIKDVIQVDKTTSVQPKLTPSHQIPEDKPIDLSNPEAPIDSKKQSKQAHPEKTEESTNIKEETLVQAPEIVVLDDKKDAEIKRELEEMHEDTPKKKKTKKVKKKVTAETSPQEEKPLPGVSTEATIIKDTLLVDIKREESTAKEKLTEHIEKISIEEDAKSVLNEPS